MKSNKTFLIILLLSIFGCLPFVFQSEKAEANRVANNTGSGSSWSPSDLASLRGWWDFDSANVTKDGSGNISAVADLSGSAGDQAQGTGAFQPIWLSANRNGLDVAQFNSSHFMTGVFDAAISGDFTVAVAHYVGANRHVICDTVSRTNGEVKESGGSLLVATSNSITSAGHSTNWVYWVLTFRDSDDQVELRVNGSSAGTATDAAFGPLSGLVLGAFPGGGNSSGTFYMGEILAFDVVLTGSDLTNLETYLTNKWL